MGDDAFEQRKRLTFEQAEGAQSLPTQLKLKDLSKQLRALLWRVVYNSLLGTRGIHAGQYILGDPWDQILSAMHTERYHRMADEFSDDLNFHVSMLKLIFENGNYLEVFGWLQWVLRRDDKPYLFPRYRTSMQWKTPIPSYESATMGYC
jgi:hypothetical protein